MRLQPKLVLCLITVLLISFGHSANAANNFSPKNKVSDSKVDVEFVGMPAPGSGKKDIIPLGKGRQEAYTIGIGDILEITVLQPDQMQNTVAVTPDGSISFPYIGTVYIKGMTLPKVQEEIQSRLADGYMKYPVVSVSLQASKSRRFFVYGEVTQPGAYPIEENVTVLRAISMAGGFTRFGSSSRVKLLRPKGSEPGYENIMININKVMNGQSEEDLLIKPGDMIVVSEGVF